MSGGFSARAPSTFAWENELNHDDPCPDHMAAARLEGVRLGLEAAAKVAASYSDDVGRVGLPPDEKALYDSGWIDGAGFIETAIRDINPAAVAALLERLK